MVCGSRVMGGEGLERLKGSLGRVRGLSEKMG